MPRFYQMLLLPLVFGIAGCQVQYRDTTGLNRGQRELNVISAKCSMYAQQVYNQSMNNAAITSLTAGGGYMNGAMLGSMIARDNSFDTCIRASGFEPVKK